VKHCISSCLTMLFFPQLYYRGPSIDFSLLLCYHFSVLLMCFCFSLSAMLGRERIFQEKSSTSIQLAPVPLPAQSDFLPLANSIAIIIVDERFGHIVQHMLIFFSRAKCFVFCVCHLLYVKCCRRSIGLVCGHVWSGRGYFRIQTKGEHVL
jgi:hypothetical protein